MDPLALWERMKYDFKLSLHPTYSYALSTLIVTKFAISLVTELCKNLDALPQILCCHFAVAQFKLRKSK